MKLSSTLVKQQNKVSIFRYIINRLSTTKPEISMDLRLSLPTVGQIISELIESGLVIEAGTQASNGGRRAMILKADVNVKKAIGIDITKNHVGLVIVNLAGEILAWKRFKKPFEERAEYIEDVRKLVTDFTKAHCDVPESVIGAGFSFPGIISPNENLLTASHALQLKNPFGFGLDDLFEHPVPVHFLNDATAVCMAEVYTGKSPTDFTLIALSNTVGGAHVSNGKVVRGDTNRSGEVGHMCIEPKGRMCYCGRPGHFDAYCSALLLAEKSRAGTVEGFFDELDQGVFECEQFFEEYLEYLALMVYNLHIANDFPIMLGGYAGNYLKKYLPRLKDKVKNLNLFEEEEEFIFFCNYNVEGAAVGSARYFMERFIDEL